MSAFEYSAIDSTGRESRGVMEGDTARQVRQQLRDQGWTPLSVSETTQAERSGRGRGLLGLTGLGGRLSARDLAVITRQLATLIEAGSPVEEALQTIARYADRRRQQKLLLALRARVVEGQSLANALAGFPRSFSEMYVATVRAGEEAGRLGGVLERLADHIERSLETRSSVAGALIYPLILTAVAFGIVALLLAYVVPEVITVFDSLAQDLPILTVALLAISAFVRDWGLPLAGLVAVAAIAFAVALRNEGFRYRVDLLLLHLPFVGPLLVAIDTGRFARTLSILAASGTPVLEALGTASQVIARRPLRAAVRRAAMQVREGESLQRALQASGWFPPMLLQLIAIGEASGELDHMLHRAADFQERETNMTVSIFVTAFEPALMLVMGGIVLFIALALLLPIFELNQLVG
ncbi:MAG: type II secretion system inner membrane protein GspF [Halofilum sp. (in: g-proteobacteria)]|nr:type II secretion system inner membrane protein GspF [Halofilum sp. (in: g-proteobacteria)]